MGLSPAANDPSVAVRRRHLPSFAREENEWRAHLWASGMRMPYPALGIPRSLISLSGLQSSGCQGQPQGTERQDCAPEGHDKHGDDAAADDAAARLGRREIGFHENLQPLLLIGDSRRDNGVEAERVARDADCVDAHRLETTPFRIVPSALLMLLDRAAHPST